MNAYQFLNDFSITNDYTQPVLAINPSVVDTKIDQFKTALPQFNIRYAVKCNPHPAIIDRLVAAKQSFEVASPAEIELLREIDDDDFDMSSVLYSNPLRSDQAIKLADSVGIYRYVVDSSHGVDKLEKLCRNPKASVYIRMVVPNEYSKFPLAGKFGVTVAEAHDIVARCAAFGFPVAGISFHVGSQCDRFDMWSSGIEIAHRMFDYIVQTGGKPTLLNIGGGFPVQYTDRVMSINEIGYSITDTIERLGFDSDVEMVAEPGRFMVAESGKLLTRVITTNVRNGKKWVYLDTGVFHGIIEASCNDFKYSYITNYGTDDLVECAIAGPTCDSLDIVTQSQLLPSKLTDNDFIVVENAGAYTSAYGTHFNGFPPPKVMIIR